jgi:hypothetical protein
MEKSPVDAMCGGSNGIRLETRIQVLLEEYRALYRLLEFRLTSMDRRLPVATGTLGVVLGTVAAIPPNTQTVFLVGLPAALAWLLTTTVAHARAKEDHLRRIDEIERSVNQLAGEELLVFQSRHPNRKKAAGRTGQGTILALLTACETMLWGCAYFFQACARPATIEAAYLGYVACIAIYLFAPVVALSRYSYRKPPPDNAPVFARRTPLPGKN